MCDDAWKNQLEVYKIYQGNQIDWLFFIGLSPRFNSFAGSRADHYTEKKKIFNFN